MRRSSGASRTSAARSRQLPARGRPAAVPAHRASPACLRRAGPRLRRRTLRGRRAAPRPALDLDRGGPCRRDRRRRRAGLHVSVFDRPEQRARAAGQGRVQRQGEARATRRQGVSGRRTRSCRTWQPPRRLQRRTPRTRSPAQTGRARSRPSRSVRGRAKRRLRRSLTFRGSRWRTCARRPGAAAGRAAYSGAAGRRDPVDRAGELDRAAPDRSPAEADKDARTTAAPPADPSRRRPEERPPVDARSQHRSPRPRHPARASAMWPWCRRRRRTWTPSRRYADAAEKHARAARRQDPGRAGSRPGGERASGIAPSWARPDRARRP